jgi:2-polyprenyl-3-methyl-5-hydroxy-6-metoxy-1,4-benzoquinol methylase
MENDYLIYGKQKSYNEVKSFLNHYYQEVKKCGYKHRTAHVLDLIDASQKTKILDYGSGWGVFSKMISEKSENINVTGIEIDSMSLKISQDVIGETENLKFLDKSIQDLSDQSFDCAISMQVIEHVHNPGNYLKEVNRVLKDGGELIISLPHILQPMLSISLLLRSQKKLNNRLKSHSLNMLENYRKEHDHIQAWDSAHFVSFAASLGFEFQEIRMVEGMPLPFIKYWHTKIFGLRNLSYKMVFKFKKRKFINITNHD